MPDLPPMFDLIVPIQRLALAEAPEPLALPARATEGSSGYDLCAALRAPHTLAPREWAAIPTGFAFEIPPGWEGQVRARSGLARRHGLTLLNGVGTIDADYRGPVEVLLLNLGREAFTIHRHQRIAQLVFVPVGRVEWRLTPSLSESGRGQGGFGHTGL